MNIRVRGIHWEKRRIKHTQLKGKQCNLLERFSYDLEMKTREQNRNNKRTETERFDSLIERIQTRVAFGWLSEHSGEKTKCPPFVRAREISPFALTKQTHSKVWRDCQKGCDSW